MTRFPLLDTLIQRYKDLKENLDNFQDLLVRINNLGQQVPPEHPRFIVLAGLYEQISALIPVIKSLLSNLKEQITILSSA